MSYPKPLFIEAGQSRRLKDDHYFLDPWRSYGRIPNYCAFSDCGELANYAGTPLCREHAAIVWEMFEEREPVTHKDLVRELHKARLEAKQVTREERRVNSHRPGRIYYLQVGDRVKIGFTTDIRQRMTQYPPNAVLLADHPGTPAMEKEMHSRFVMHLADGREWFEPNEKLTAHIAEVNKKFPRTEPITGISSRTTKPLTVRAKTLARRV